MSIKGNLGNKEVTKDLLLHTGIVKAKVLAINPTLEEIQTDLGINFEKDPAYLSEDTDGIKKVRIDIWLHFLQSYKNSDSKDCKVDTKTKVVFFLADRNKENQDKTKFCYINDFGQTCWCLKDEVPAEKWFNPQGSRVCYEGEDLLIAFIRSWVNSGRTDDTTIDVAQLIAGNYKELQDLVKIYGVDEHPPMKAMLCVQKGKDGKFYQNVYNKFFAPWNTNSIIKWQKYIKQDSRNVPVKAGQGKWSYPIEEFSELPLIEPDAEATAKTVEDSEKWV